VYVLNPCTPREGDDIYYPHNVIRTLVHELAHIYCRELINNTTNLDFLDDKLSDGEISIIREVMAHGIERFCNTIAFTVSSLYKIPEEINNDED
jgi:hypothetical protein